MNHFPGKRIALATAILLSTAPSLHAYTAHDGNIYDNLGNPININGVNWAGFQDSGFVDELYGSIPFYPLGTSVPFALIDMMTHPWDNSGTGVTKSASVSFKTIRLPIEPSNLRDNTVNSHFRYDLTDAKNKLQGNGVFCQTWDAQHCTAGLSVKESLYRIISEFQKNNIRVLVDFHQTPVGRNGNVVESNYSLANYSADVTELALQIKSRGLSNVIGVDVFNEPHNLSWFSASGSQPSWVSVIQTAGLAIYKNNPDLLLFVEGPSTTSRADLHICVPLSGPTTPPAEPTGYTLISNSQYCGSNKYEFVPRSNWGESFGDLLDTAAALKGNAVFDTTRFKTAVCGSNTAFCTWLLGDPTKPGSYGHLVFSPHVYGQHVATWQTSPKASPFRFDWNWGFLVSSGIPVVIGETGYLPSATTDVSFFQNSLSPYMLSRGISHNLFYWTWNTNSGDTGGVRQNANTIQLVALKEADLAKLYNSSVDSGTLSLTAASSSDPKCASASDSLLLDGGSSGLSFTVNNGASQTVSTGTHSLALASSSGGVPAGNGQTGKCFGKLSASTVNVSKNQTSSVTGTWQYQAAQGSGTLKVTSSASSDTKCASATDTLFVDGASTGTAFAVSTGISLPLSAGTHTLRLTSSGSSIPAGSGNPGTCSSVLSTSQVTVTTGQTSPVSATYAYKGNTSGKSCTLIAAEVTSQSNWGFTVNQVNIAVSLQGFGSLPLQINGTLNTKNSFVQNIWGNFGLTSTVSGSTANFSGSLWGTQFTIGGFIRNDSPLKVGNNPLISMSVNGVPCN